QLVDPLLSPPGDDDLRRLAPARAQQPGQQRLADLPGAEDRDAPRVAHGAILRGGQAGLVLTEPPELVRVDREPPGAPPPEPGPPRQSLPFAVRLEQLPCLPALDEAAAHGGQQLHEAEVTDHAAVEAAEALDEDDADRPRAEAALALQPLGDRVALLVEELLEPDRP